MTYLIDQPTAKAALDLISDLSEAIATNTPERYKDEAYHQQKREVSRVAHALRHLTPVFPTNEDGTDYHGIQTHAGSRLFGQVSLDAILAIEVEAAAQGRLNPITDAEVEAYAESYAAFEEFHQRTRQLSVQLNEAVNQSSRATVRAAEKRLQAQQAAGRPVR